MNLITGVVDKNITVPNNFYPIYDFAHDGSLLIVMSGDLTSRLSFFRFYDLNLNFLN